MHMISKKHYSQIREKIKTNLQIEPLLQTIFIYRQTFNQISNY